MSAPENPAAFPSVCRDDPGHPASAPGMTLRDWFAGQALAGTLADTSVFGELQLTARVAYNYADAMLAERAKGGAA